MQRRREREGDRGVRLAVSAIMALTGAVFLLALVFEDVSHLTNTAISELPWGLILRYAIAMGIGGAIAGYILATLFGRAGVIGWLVALLGGVAATTLAGVIGSFVGLIPDLLMTGWQSSNLAAVASGALVLPLAWAGWPILIPVWGALVLTAHVWARRMRNSA